MAFIILQRILPLNNVLILLQQVDIIITMARLPDHAENDLCAAALRGDLEAMQRCLVNGADLNTCPQNGDSTLYHALSSEKREPIEFLIEKGANMTWYDKYGISIFQHVLLRGKLNQVEIF